MSWTSFVPIGYEWNGLAVGLDIYERASTTWNREEGFTAKGMKVQTHGPPVLVYFLFFTSDIHLATLCFGRTLK